MAGSVKVTDLPTEINDKLRKLFKGHGEGFRRFGDAGYLMPTSYTDYAEPVRNMPLRPDDIWVATFPRCGTTWTQEMVWLLKNNLDYEAAKELLVERYIFLEIYTYVHEQLPELEKLDDESRKAFGAFMSNGIEQAKVCSSPRFIKTHLPMSLLPLNMLEKTKVVYVARDPRDAAVSYFFHNKLIKFHDYQGDFKTYWRLFLDDLVGWAPFMAHVKEAWNLRNHPNLLFLFYEDMIKDLPSVVRRVSTFLGKEYSDEEVTKLCDHLDFKNFKSNESAHPSWLKKSHFINSSSEPFVRKGKSGGWRDYFDAEMAREADEWLAQHLADTDLRFPNVTS